MTLIRAAPGQHTERGDFHYLDWWQQLVVMRLRMGHSWLNARKYRTIKLEPSPACHCSLEGQMAKHYILQRCPLLQTAGQNVWPTVVQLHTKLYRSKEELDVHPADWTLSVVVIRKRNYGAHHSELSCLNFSPHKYFRYYNYSYYMCTHTCTHTCTYTCIHSHTCTHTISSFNMDPRIHFLCQQNCFWG